MIEIDRLTEDDRRRLAEFLNIGCSAGAYRLDATLTDLLMSSIKVVLHE